MNTLPNEFLSLLESPTRGDIDKCNTFYALASRVKGGAVFELGKYYAPGVVALALGVAVSQPKNIEKLIANVYSVDCLSRPRGWKGEKIEHQMADDFYSFIDTARFNIEELRQDNLLFVVSGPISEVAHSVVTKISLLVWDIEVGRTMDNFCSWDGILPIGGTLALHSTGEDQGTLYDQLKSRYKLREVMPGNVTVMIKEKDNDDKSSNVPVFAKVRLRGGEWN